jgi:UDP-GlcNAc:undecaprenyl-phosphate GlcNAc-1-phosphate transferase
MAYGAVALVAVIVTAVANRPARSISRRVGYAAQPDARKVHVAVTPYGGGVAMFIGLCVAMMVSTFVPVLHNVIASSHEAIGVLLAAGVIFTIGLVDDFRDMSAPAKVAGEVLAASILYFSGCTMYQLKLPFAGFVVLGPSLLPLLTAVWVFALSNAINLIDGLDGLAGGIVAIASGTLCVYGLRLEDLGLLPVTNVGPLIAAVTCGICLGFLPDNFHPAKLFMGDAGALMLGLLMSASTMVIGGRTPPTSGVTFFFFAPLLIPVFILGVPLLDAVLAFVRRTASGQGFQTADKNHIHHRLLRLGHGHRRTVIILWLWTGLLSCLRSDAALLPQSKRLHRYRRRSLGDCPLHLVSPQLRQSGDEGGEQPSQSLEGSERSWSEPNNLPGLGALLSLGSTIATCVALGVLAGLGVDSWLGTRPVGLLVGLGLGVVLAIVSAIKLVRRWLSRPACSTISLRYPAASAAPYDGDGHDRQRRGHPGRSGHWIGVGARSAWRWARHSLLPTCDCSIVRSPGSKRVGETNTKRSAAS